MISYLISLLVPQKPKSISPEERAAIDARLKHQRAAEDFKKIFGFEHTLMSEERYKKELFLKLALHAKQVKEAAETAARLGSEYFREEYTEISQSYMDSIEIIGIVNPTFQKQIPHWTELEQFVQEWIRGNYSQKTERSSRAIVST
jgi:hypothetical protein